MKSSEKEKNKKHLNDHINQRRNFAPYVVSCEGMLGENINLPQFSGEKISDKWNRPYCATVSFFRKTFAIALFRAKIGVLEVLQ